jgi:hypothetical protein
MKVIRERINKQGKREVVVVLEAGEYIAGIQPNSYYKTGYPQEQVVQGYILIDSEEVTWCSLGQEWVS